MLPLNASPPKAIGLSEVFSSLVLSLFSALGEVLSNLVRKPVLRLGEVFSNLVEWTCSGRERLQATENRRGADASSENLSRR